MFISFNSVYALCNVILDLFLLRLFFAKKDFCFLYLFSLLQVAFFVLCTSILIDSLFMYALFVFASVTTSEVFN